MGLHKKFHQNILGALLSVFLGCVFVGWAFLGCVEAKTKGERALESGVEDGRLKSLCFRQGK